MDKELGDTQGASLQALHKQLGKENFVQNALHRRAKVFGCVAGGGKQGCARSQASPHSGDLRFCTSIHLGE